MSYVTIMFTFHYFHRVKLPSLGNGEDSGLNICLCVFPARDFMEDEINHPTNYLPTDIFPWASPGGVGDQQAAPGGSISSCAKIRCSSGFSKVCAFILKCHFYSSYQLCFYLPLKLQTSSLVSPPSSGCWSPDVRHFQPECSRLWCFSTEKTF